MASGLFGATPTTVKQVKCCFSQEAIKGWKSRSAENFTSVNYGNRSFRPKGVSPDASSPELKVDSPERKVDSPDEYKCKSLRG